MNKEEHISSEDFLRDEKESKKREQEEKRIRKKYKFSDKEHSRWGIASSIIAVFAFAFIVAAIVISTNAGGQGGTLVGVLGAASFISALAGIVIGLLAFRQLDVFYRFAWVGIFANGIIWLIVSALIVLGL